MTFNTKAIVIKSISWPRQARLYILYTERFGKIKCAAAGSQKIKSKVAGHLQPFCITEVMIAKGRNIDKLAQGRLMQRFPAFYRDFHLYVLGSYILEVLDLLTQDGVADYKLWKKINDILQQLGEQALWRNDYENILQMHLLTRVFSLQLLDHFGYRPEFYNCVFCREEVNSNQSYFSVAQGGVVCPSCEKIQQTSLLIDNEVLKFLRISIKQSIGELSKVIVSSHHADGLVGIIDQLIALQTQKVLNSPQLLASRL